MGELWVPRDRETAGSRATRVVRPAARCVWRARRQAPEHMARALPEHPARRDRPAHPSTAASRAAQRPELANPVPPPGPRRPGAAGPVQRRPHRAPRELPTAPLPAAGEPRPPRRASPQASIPLSAVRSARGLPGTHRAPASGPRPAVSRGSASTVPATDTPRWASVSPKRRAAPARDVAPSSGPRFSTTGRSATSAAAPSGAMPSGAPPGRASFMCCPMLSVCSPSCSCSGAWGRSCRAALTRLRARRPRATPRGSARSATRLWTALPPRLRRQSFRQIRRARWCSRRAA